MDESSMAQNRRSRRSNVLMSASIELSGTSVPVKLRNLSADGALIEGDNLPVEGSELVFRKAELSLDGRVAWVHGKRAGIAFAQVLCPEAVLRHVPMPRPRVQAEFKRPGLHVRSISESERRGTETYVWRVPDRP
jgi:hypothetical protein